MSPNPIPDLLPRKGVRHTGFDHDQDASASHKLPRLDYKRAQDKLHNDDNQSPAEHDSHLSQADGDRPSVPSQSSSPLNLDEARFSHQPLQLDTPSIRLISVETPKPDGTISCTVRHATLAKSSGIDDFNCVTLAGTFTCLSYVWGPCEPTRDILVNEKRFGVRLNLWQFLSAVSSMRAREEDSKLQSVAEKGFSVNWGHTSWGPWYQSLWIDALCIDQANNGERNHQVQQMGRIYTGARRVISWLGDNSSLVRSVKAFEDKKVPPMYPQGYSDHRDALPGIEELYGNAYWQRAWVVQEVMLAEEVWFHAQDAMISVPELKFAVAYMEKVGAKALVDLVDRIGLNLPCDATFPRLVENIEVFGLRMCSDIRDRVFSLLSVSCNGAELAVDYSCSPIELARKVLRLSGASICIYSAFMVVQALELDLDSSDMDLCSPFIMGHCLKTLRHITPCAQCSEDAGVVPLDISASMIVDTRFVCLHCSHPNLVKQSGSHRARHMGHLCLLRNESSGEFDYESLLYWIAMGGGSWRKLESFKYVITGKKGGFRSLTFSLGLICELMALVQADGGRRASNIMRFYNQTHASAWTSKWKVIG